jgi:HTH-type transcriptional regulator/antitoxin HigA
MMTPVSSPGYLELIHRFPLRPIRSDEELEQATRIAEELDSREDLDAGGRDYLDVLLTMIEKYEDQHDAIPDVSGSDMLRGLIEFRGLSQAEVARGTRIAESALSEILAGKRVMGRKTIETLARYFHVDPGVFLPSVDEGNGS